MLHNHYVCQGEHCEACQPFFIGSGIDECISCLEFCHGNSIICVDADWMSNENQSVNLDMINTTIVSQYIWLINIIIVWSLQIE